MIKVSVLITTLNEAENLPRCLSALKCFDDIIVIDSTSQDRTVEVAHEHGARVESFEWNGSYPKKRQYCLDYLNIKNDYIFFVDADEEVTPDLVEEIRSLDLKIAGYFVRGQYCWNGKVLCHGLQNNKLVLFDKNKIEYPVVDDLGDFCMGEMEGHYQPVLKPSFKGDRIGQAHAPLKHSAYEDKVNWHARHLRYAAWEAGMIVGNKYPHENNSYRELLKKMFRKIAFRGEVAFIHSYIMKAGFLDGRAGLAFAQSRRNYYRMVNRALKTNTVLGECGVERMQETDLGK